MLYILYEHATGYSLFHVQEVEEVGALLPTVERAITDVALFKTIVKLIAFSPFKSGTNALDNANAISEGIVHDDLKLFLETNVPTGKKAKKSGFELGVSDTRITATIQDELGIKCAVGDAVTEIFRGLRLHFANLVKGLTPQGEAKAQLGLAHSYSRAKVKFNVNRADNMIIQSIALLDQLDKDINTFSMRVREWYSYHFPEMVKVVSENYQYCRMVKLVGNRKILSGADETFIEKMDEITMDSAKSKAIIDASKMSMGMDISPIDLINIQSFSARVISLAEYRRSLVQYLHSRMESVAPNLASLIGDMVGARLISHAGSLTNLAKYPASTVQILGAEKALFRALKTKGNTPKYGLIFHSTFIGRAAAKNKGRISRFLANKCSMASRIDCFSEQPSNIFGEKLKEQVEERLKFFETGDTPRKNVDVMKEALAEAAEFIKTEKINGDAADESMKKKKKKKKRKSEVEEMEISQIVSDGEDNEAASPAKRPKLENETSALDTSEKKKKKKKKKEAAESAEESMEVSAINDSVVSVEGGENDKKSKKKKKKAKAEQSMADTTADETIGSVGDQSMGKKKKKKKKVNGSSLEEEVSTADDTNASIGDADSSMKKKKKKAAAATGNKMNGSSHEEQEEMETSAVKEKKKKKKAAVIVSEVAQDADKSAKKKKRKSLDVSKAEISAIGDDSVLESGETPKKVKKAKKKKSIAVDE
ncbi:nucleolar protein 56-like [Styela clava]